MALSGSEVDMLNALMKRVADVERRVAELEAGGARLAPHADPCPSCGGPLRLTDERDHPVFGAVGLKQRAFTCDRCGRTVTRDWDPAKG